MRYALLRVQHDEVNDALATKSLIKSIESVFGSVTPATETQAFKQIARDAREEKVKREVRKLEQP